MRFLYGADWHWSESVPVHRKDDFLSSQEAKIRKVFDLAKDYRVDAIIQGGDIFHHHQASYSFAHRVIALLKSLQSNVYRCPFIVNQGNHDLLGGRLASTYQGAIGMLADADVVYLPTIEGPFTDLEIGGEPFRFIPYRIRFSFNEYNTNRIVVNHDMVTTHTCIYDHVEASSIAPHTKSPLILCSHWHSQFITQHGQTTFANPGPMMRRSIDEKSLDPSVLLVEVQKGALVSISFLSLDANKDVFVDPSSIQPSINKNVQEAATLLQEKFEYVPLEEVVRTVAQQLGTPCNVLDYALEHLQKASHLEVAA